MTPAYVISFAPFFTRTPRYATYYLLNTSTGCRRSLSTAHFQKVFECQTPSERKRFASVFLLGIGSFVAFGTSENGLFIRMSVTIEKHVGHGRVNSLRFSCGPIKSI
jgi:hypothetical protein